MDDRDFKELKAEIHRLKLKLYRLQAMYRAETGRDYVISGPLGEPSGLMRRMIRWHTDYEDDDGN